jgi:hypothetical protein
MIASQYVHSAAAYNFGFTYRKHWLRNYLLVFLVVCFTFIHYWVTLVPGALSCLLRVNCVNEDNIVPSVYNMGPVAIQNPYNNTLMPPEFRRFLAVLMTCNGLAVLGWEFFIVGHGYGKVAWLWLVGCLWKEEIEREEYSPITFTNDGNQSTSKRAFKDEDP